MKNYFSNIIALVGLFFIVSCGNDKGKSAQAAQQQTPSLPVLIVPTRTLTAYNKYPAQIEGIVNSEVRAKVQGYITDVLVDEGEKVKKGQLLFKLETNSLNQEANAAKANVNAAQVEVDKLKPLVDKNIISPVQLETAKAKLQQAKSNYNSVAANIGYANIKSPVDGYVGEIRFRKGALISPADQKPLTTVADISKVYAYFSMNEKDYLDFIQNAEGETMEEKIQNMPPVSLILANGSTYDQKGKIETINSQVNNETGSVSFRAVFDNPSRLLTNGNSGQIQIPKTYTNAVVVPQESTYEQQGNTYVFQVSNKVAVSHAFSVKAAVDNLYIVESGVKEGDTIVAQGVSSLQDGTSINPNLVSFDSIAKPLEKVFK